MRRRAVLIGTFAPIVGSRSCVSATQGPTPSSTAQVVSPARVVASGFDSPEGPAFDRDGNLFFVNWSTSDILKQTPEGEVSVFFNTGGIPAGLAFHPDGSLYVADEGADIHGILRITPDAQSEIVVNAYDGSPLNGCNDLVFDRNGTLYFSDPWNTENGAFYRLFAEGTLEQIDSGLAFPNGVALNANEDAVILAESGMNRLLRYSIESDGTIGERAIWLTLDGSPAPDGMAFDVNGDLYVAHYGTGHVDIFNEDGQLVEQIMTPGSEVTNVAFGGPDNRTLIVTDVTSASVYAIELTVSGQPLNDGRSYD